MQGVPDSILIPLGIPPSIALDVPLKLRLEGIVLCQGSEDDVALFLRALRWMAVQERKPVQVTGTETAATTVSSQQFMRGLKIPKAQACQVRRLSAILLVERWGGVLVVLEQMVHGSSL